MTLLVLPLVLALISFIIPEKFVRYFGLAGALGSLAVAVGHLSYFNPERYVSLFDPNRVFPLGLSFKMGYDGLSLTMVLLV